MFFPWVILLLLKMNIFMMARSQFYTCPYKAGVFYATTPDCLIYFRCQHHMLWSGVCFPWQRFDIHRLRCSWIGNVDCNPKYAGIWQPVYNEGDNGGTEDGGNGGIGEGESGGTEEGENGGTGEEESGGTEEGGQGCLEEEESAGSGEGESGGNGEEESGETEEGGQGESAGSGEGESGGTEGGENGETGEGESEGTEEGGHGGTGEEESGGRGKSENGTGEEERRGTEEEKNGGSEKEGSGSTEEGEDGGTEEEKSASTGEGENLNTRDEGSISKGEDGSNSVEESRRTGEDESGCADEGGCGGKWETEGKHTQEGDSGAAKAVGNEGIEQEERGKEEEGKTNNLDVPDNIEKTVGESSAEEENDDITIEHVEEITKEPECGDCNVSDKLRTTEDALEKGKGNKEIFEEYDKEEGTVDFEPNTRGKVIAADKANSSKDMKKKDTQGNVGKNKRATHSSINQDVVLSNTGVDSKASLTQSRESVLPDLIESNVVTEIVNTTNESCPSGVNCISNIASIDQTLTNTLAETKQEDSSGSYWYWCGSGRFVLVQGNEDGNDVCVQLQDQEYINQEGPTQQDGNFAGHSYLGSDVNP